MLTFIVVLSAAFTAVILTPSQALAWGPVSHIVHGSSVLANITSLPAALQAALSAYPNAYLYGCIGADIIQAKAYAKSVATHCHRWPVAWKFVRSARSQEQRAFAWGYMTHLAADIISHNHFVPSNLLRSFERRTMGHAYWEARADSLQRQRHWELVRKVLEDDYPACDALVEAVIDDTLFSFRTNKKIFDSMMAVSKLNRWQAFIKTVNRNSRHVLTRRTVDRYNEACLSSAMDLLVKQKSSFTQDRDPTGQQVLKRAITLRRKLRVLKRQRRLPAATEKELSGQILPDLGELSNPGA